MNEYIDALRKHVAEDTPNYGSDAQSTLEMLFTYYHECNNTDTDTVKVAFVSADVRDAPLSDGLDCRCRLHSLQGA